MNKVTALSILCSIILSFFAGVPVNDVPSSASDSPAMEVSYEVGIAIEPEATLTIRATYLNVTSPLDLDIGYENYSFPDISVLKGLQLTGESGSSVSWAALNSRTIRITPTGGTIIASYYLDMSQNYDRQAKVSVLGGVLSGYMGFLLPSNQEVDTVRVNFSLPSPWKVVSAYPQDGDWFTVQPFTYADLVLETKASGWFFGNVDFDQTKTYEDGFEIRVVGFKYFPYEHWNSNLGDTPLEEALKSADFYYQSIQKVRVIFGGFPYPRLLLVGPGYWQAGSTLMNQQLVGWERYDYIPHHVVHASFGAKGSRVSYSGRFYTLLREGYPTYVEGFMTAEISGDAFWRGMLYERKFHYLRTLAFDNLQQNTISYVHGFVVTYLMDHEIRQQTGGQKGIDDLMARVWQKYSTPNFVSISDEQILQTLQEITGSDWHSFYNQNVVNTRYLNVDTLDDLKPDFEKFLTVVSNRWYNGYSSMYFVGQEITAAAGDLDMDVRMQSRIFPPNVYQFAAAAHLWMTANQADLGEAEVEQILHQVTGKDHSDFFEFYRSQGYALDLGEINGYLHTVSFTGYMGDNAFRFEPHTIALGTSTQVVGEVLDPDFVSARELTLQLQVYGRPIGATNIENLITGNGVSFQWTQEFSNGEIGPGANYIFNLPLVQVDGKTYTFFTINLPQDAGVMIFKVNAKIAEPSHNDWLGGFIGTRKVFFQDTASFQFVPVGSAVTDETPPVFAVTQPASAEINSQASSYCVEGLAEPGARIMIDTEEAGSTNVLFGYRGCVDLHPGTNILTVTASDGAGNVSSREIIIYVPEAITPSPEAATPSPTSANTNDGSMPIKDELLPSLLVGGGILLASGLAWLALRRSWSAGKKKG